MSYESLDVVQFQRKYDSQEKCLQAIFQARWPRGFVCPHCEHNDCYRLSKRRAVQCTNCRRQTSITAGTLFHRTQIPLQNWFWLMFLMSQDKGGISTKRAAKLLGMHYGTVWVMMHKIREAMSDRVENRLLSGFVEVDGGYFGGKLRGKSETQTALSNKKQVCVMVERLNRSAGDAVLVVLDAADDKAYQVAVERSVEPMSHIRTDGLSKNSTLHGIAGTLNMKKTGNDYTVDEGPLKNVDRVISLAKRYLLGTYHQYCSRKHLQRFLNEYVFRFNRRYEWCQLLSRTLKACALKAPVSYAALS